MLQSPIDILLRPGDAAHYLYRSQNGLWRSKKVLLGPPLQAYRISSSRITAPVTSGDFRFSQIDSMEIKSVDM